MEFEIKYVVRIPDYANRISFDELPKLIRDVLEKLGLTKITQLRSEIYYWFIDQVNVHIYLIKTWVREYPFFIKIEFDSNLGAITSIQLYPCIVNVINQNSIEILTLDRIHVKYFIKQ